MPSKNKPVDRPSPGAVARYNGKVFRNYEAERAKVEKEHRERNRDDDLPGVKRVKK